MLRGDTSLEELSSGQHWRRRVDQVQNQFKKIYNCRFSDKCLPFFKYNTIRYYYVLDLGNILQRNLGAFHKLRLPI